MEQRYLKIKEAAKYLDYSRDYFTRLVAEYRIPKKGPGGNRFDIRDLEAFMNDPTIFLIDQPQAQHKRREFTPVSF